MKRIIPLIVFLITVFSSLALSPFEPLFGSASGLGDIYSRAPALIDSILYLVFFISLCLFALERVFSRQGEVNKYGKTIAVVLGIALAIAASIWSTVSGFNLAGFGWMAGLLFIGFIFAAVFKIVKVIGGNNRKAEAVAYVIIYFCAFWVFPRVAELLGMIPWLTLIFSLIFIIALLYLFVSIFSKFKVGGGSESSDSSGRDSEPAEKKPGWTTKAKLWFNKKEVSRISDEIKSIERKFDREEKRNLSDLLNDIEKLKKTGVRINEVRDALSRLESGSDINDEIRKKIDDLKKELDSLEAGIPKLLQDITEDFKKLEEFENTKIKVYQEEYEQVKKKLDELVKSLEDDGNLLSDKVAELNKSLGSDPSLVEPNKKNMLLLEEANNKLEEWKVKIGEINNKLLYVVGQEKKTRDKLKIARGLWGKIGKEMTKDDLTVITDIGKKTGEIAFDENGQDKYIKDLANYIKKFETVLNGIRTDYFDKVGKSVEELNKVISTPVEEPKEEDKKEKIEEVKKDTVEGESIDSISKRKFDEEFRTGFETLRLIKASLGSIKKSIKTELFQDLNKKSVDLEKKLTNLQSNFVDEKALPELTKSIEQLYQEVVKLKEEEKTKEISIKFIKDELDRLDIINKDIDSVKNEYGEKAVESLIKEHESLKTALIKMQKSDSIDDKILKELRDKVDELFDKVEESDKESKIKFNPLRKIRK